MKPIKKIVSLALAATMVTSTTAFAFSVNAASNDEVGVSSTAPVQANVQDGVILHAFNWSYNSIKENLPSIAAAGYSTVQTSPVQQPKDYSTSADISGQWWKLYQPVSMKIAEQSWLGTKAELTELCAEAEKYGIKIICDIVSNHMGNEVETDSDSLSPQVQIYQPDFYENKEDYFHHTKGSTSDSSVKSIVQGHLSNCPDLNTGNQDVQDAVVTLLKECIDCGVDGFRFDAAKHIETPDDGEYASDYWVEISSRAGEYYKEKTGNDLYIYGEILNTCGAGRSFSSYTDYINVTDNKTGDAVLYNVVNGKASTAAKATYKSGVDASDVVLWAESHDTFEGTSGSAGISNTASISDENIVKAWAIVASRKDATALYFARPGAALMGEAANNTTYKSTAVSEINKFHNNFVGQSEALGASDGVAYVVRGTSGIVLSNTKGTNADVSIASTGLADGTYTDTITGNQFTVTAGTLTGSIGSTGVAVVYDETPTPRSTCSAASGTFKGETMVTTLGLENAVSGTYCIDGSTPVTYTETTTIRIGSDYSYGDTITLTLTATDGKGQTSTDVYKYVKQEDNGSGIYIFFNAAKRASWKAPYNVYIYDEETSDTVTYKNGGWPGQSMEYDEASGYYYVEVPTTSMETDNETGEMTSCDFDLSKSEYATVIISGSGSNQQYPGDGSSTKLRLGQHSKIFALTNSKSWTDTDLVPTKQEVEATEVTRPVTEPTTEATEPTTEEPTTAPSKWTVAGDEALTGYMWDAAQNEMTQGEYTYNEASFDYMIQFDDVAAGSYGCKVTNGTWDECYPEANVSITTNDTGYVKVYFNSTTKDIAVDAEYAFTWELEYITVVGNGDGNWLNGESWAVDAEDNRMTEVAPGVWEISFEDIDAFDNYQVKFACNGSWQPYNWTIDGVLDGQDNPSNEVAEDGSTVTLRIDVNGFDFKTGTGSVVTEFKVDAPDAPKAMYGDVNGDGAITVEDATLLQKISLGLVEATNEQLICADVTGDGNVSIRDVTLVQKFIAGGYTYTGLTGEPAPVAPVE